MYNYLKWSFAVVFVDDAESANIGSKGSDLGRDVDEKLVLIDKSVVAAFGRRHIQTGNGVCK